MPDLRRPQLRFGIGEWYGLAFTELSVDERKQFAQLQIAAGERAIPLCPFLSTAETTVACWKVGGVCSLRKYERDPETEEARVSAREPSLRTTCPSRFEEDTEIYAWIGEIVLRRRDARPIGQVNFLERVPLMGSEGEEPSGEVGRIDNVLIVPDTNPLQWCAVEIQAVYFSGDSMDKDFRAIAAYDEDNLPFPAGRRRPDYRSSGPKRLMPQLQIKVPTLRRWGKRMAVVVDEDFFRAMGRMNTVADLSNCDVAWFVACYDDNLRLRRGDVYFTTLEESVQGLVAGRPVTLDEFEQRILRKLSRLPSRPIEIPTDD